MNKTQLEKLKNKRVRLRPLPCDVDDNGRLMERDELWNVVRVDDSGVHLSSNGDMTQLPLGFDHIRECMSDPPGDGFLILKVQIKIRGKKVYREPFERLPPTPQTPGLVHRLPAKTEILRSFSKEERDLLVAAAETGEFQIAGIGVDQVPMPWVRVLKKPRGWRDFINQDDPAVAARYRQAFQSLTRKGLIERVEGNSFILTGDGFSRARELATSD